MIWCQRLQVLVSRVVSVSGRSRIDDLGPQNTVSDQNTHNSRMWDLLGSGPRQFGESALPTNWVDAGKASVQCLSDDSVVIASNIDRKSR